MSNYEVRTTPHYNSGLYAQTPVTKVEADSYGTDLETGELHFYKGGERIASFAPGRWDSVQKVEYAKSANSHG